MKHIPSTAAIAVASGVAVASLALPTAAQTQPTAATARAPHHQTITTDPVAAGAGYLARRFGGKHHDHLVGSFKSGSKTIKFADYGETADAVLSLDAAGVAQRAAKRATKYLEAKAKTYALGGLPAPDYYPGSLAKLLLVAEAQHVNPHRFGGLNLIAALDNEEGVAGAQPGQFQNPGDTDFGSSTLIQSLAVLALSNTVVAHGQPDANAVSFLASQQCGNGAFQVAIRQGTTVDCQEGDKDIDATGYAAQALIAGSDHSAASSALAWLRQVENHDGAWGETIGAKSDANSTAIAIEARIAAHTGDAKPMRWLAGRVQGCNAPTSRRGAVAFQKGKFDKVAAIRATSQALVPLAGHALTSVDKNGATKAAPELFCPIHRRHRKP